MRNEKSISLLMLRSLTGIVQASPYGIALKPVLHSAIIGKFIMGFSQQGAYDHQRRTVEAWTTPGQSAYHES